MSCRYEVERGTPVGYPQLVASYAAPSSSEAAGENGAEAGGAAAAAAAAAQGARNSAPGALNILGEIASKLIMTPSLDQLGLSVAGEGGLPKARQDLLAQEEAAVAAAAAATAEGAETAARDGVAMSAVGEEMDGE